MESHTKTYKVQRDVWKSRIANTKFLIAQYEKQLGEAQELIITLQQERIPELIKKIEESHGHLDYSLEEWERQYGDERDLKQEKIARLRDHITRLEREVRDIEQSKKEHKWRKQKKK